MEDSIGPGFKAASQSLRRQSFTQRCTTDSVQTKVLVQSQSRRHHLECFRMTKTDHLKVCHHHLRCRGRMCPSSTVDTYMRGSQEASRSPNSTTGDGLLHLLQSPPHSYSQNYNDGDGRNNDFCSQTVDRRHAQSFAKFVILYTTAHALFQFFEMSW